ncbi:drug efflux system protein MdtG [compost metagenome]
MTFIAVVSDYLLHPFYPHFFALRFQVEDSRHVGYYFSALCLVVMIAFPFWAFIAKWITELRILIFTQFCAGILALYCLWTDSLVLFWVVSLVMVFFKGSYLLVYPYTLKVVPETEHHNTIGLLSVIVHMGSILGALIGGFVVGFVHPAKAFLVMAAGDFIQMGMSFYLLRSKRFQLDNPQKEIPDSVGEGKSHLNYFLLKLALVTMLLYFSDYLIRPFFTRYWESVSVYNSNLISGCIYAIPGFIALIALWYNAKSEKPLLLNKQLITALMLGMIGLVLQGIPNEWTLISGRMIYGWALFQATVKFDVLLFQNTTPERYALDYSKVYLAQSFGVLGASSMSGILVSLVDYSIPFPFAALGFALTLTLFLVFFVRFKNAIGKEVKI